MQSEFCSIGSNDGQRCFARATGVDDDDVARLEHVGQVAKCDVFNRIITLPGDHQPNLVPAESACFGRFARFQVGWQVKY